MSRLIVKNLPNGIKEDRFRELFAAFGTLTDCSLKYTKDGKFRKFGFIGFVSEEEAKAALGHFNKSYIDTSRVSVELCKSFGDPEKPKAWSKHSQKNDKDSEKKKDSKQTPTDSANSRSTKNNTTALEELEKEDDFKEFLSVHQNRTKTSTWDNDTHVVVEKKQKSQTQDDYLNFDSESEEDNSENEVENDDRNSVSTGKLALKSEISDMEYLKSKVVRDPCPALSEEIVEGEEAEKSSEDDEAVTLPQSTKKIEQQDSKKRKEPMKKKSAVQNEPTTSYTVKLRGAPFNVTEQNVKEFLVPLKPVAIRIARNTYGNKTGYVFVDLSSEEEVQKALKRNKDYMGGRYIEVFRDNYTKSPSVQSKAESRPWEQRDKQELQQEDLSESGRLFVRNLPYSCTEDDLDKLFSKYGPISEIHFPIDSLTKKPKGFAFVTFLITEHAVKAYAEVDGQIFQGRLLHVLPSAAKKEEVNESEGDASGYKKQKALKDKAVSSSSHNWNTLFMGTSSVADVIAQKYNTSKSQVLDDGGKGSLAVRVALGETQLVQDVRRFLIENGVSLDSFSQAAGPRSKTVILVKNLPAGTKPAELQELFGRFGDLGRVLLPEGGISAVMEFLEPTEAKRAFYKLAYTKFHHVPLYLEWAPMDVFTCPPPQKKVEQTEQETSEEQEADAAGTKQEVKELEVEEQEEDEEETLPGCTLFIKNLNFSTSEETLKEVFSKVGTVKSCSISKKKDKSGSLLSMGFGFVEYMKPEQAQKALRRLQQCMVDGHQVEIKLSERAIRAATSMERKKQISKKQQSSKILVRNVPFQATVREIRELFSTFGELKTVRLPKKMAGTGSHRGFGFVDFVTKQDAKRAFSALCHSTHLYGRRLVLEWAETEDSVETLRRKTAEHYHGSPKKKKKVSDLMDDFMESLDKDNEDE
ncbi:RNA binding motif protein 19 L homeolog [Xenopus laevis]|uniref:Probable RNA-binding protein 19 n=1 Tax=Xenopus laevis TaxID=8355 RepID=Q63ZN5_XENLA|nr:RNA binding motif protein 19 L homeolog [Xenopus laevis]AAH82875.1 LOC494769 protein [Xenopus laevis]